MTCFDAKRARILNIFFFSGVSEYLLLLLVLPLFHVSREFFALFALRIQFWILYNLYIRTWLCWQNACSANHFDEREKKKYTTTHSHECTFAQRARETYIKLKNSHAEITWPFDLNTGMDC